MTQPSATSDAVPGRDYTTFQTTALVILRIFIGWHFVYEGLAKLVNPYWTSAGYLAESQWWFSGFFISIAASPTALTAVDFINAWGLLLVGLGLMLGLLTRTATVGAIVLLTLYYIAVPPLPGYAYSMPMEGSYLIVNKTLIELVAVVVLLAFPTGRSFGLDGLIPWKGRTAQQTLTQASA